MYRHRLRVILLSLGVVLGYGSAAAHLIRHHDRVGADRYGWHHACADWPWSPEPAPAAPAPAPDGASGSKHVQ